MARVGFRMNLKQGNEAEYKKRHDGIWPELTQLLHDTGIRNYTIFRDGLTLFAYLEIDDPAALDELPDKELMRKWWVYMEPLMVYNDDSTPAITMLEEAFHQD